MAGILLVLWSMGVLTHMSFGVVHVVLMIALAMLVIRAIQERRTALQRAQPRLPISSDRYSE